jgi:peptide-methionine (R)-S-oxide reductase
MIPRSGCERSCAADAAKGGPVSDKVVRTDDEWRSLLTAEQFRVLRRAGTEPAFSGEYTDLEDEGIYRCAGCSAELFSSRDKFHSGCGWPSFTRPVEDEAVTEHTDQSFGMRRVEVRCARCEGHLGHVFTDGPKPTGLRYCINSVSLEFASGDTNEA